MRREILCPKCAAMTCETFKIPDTGGQADSEDEHVKMVAGVVKPKLGAARLRFACDGCAVLIMGGEPVYAVSIWSDRYGAPYVPWESEYLATKGAPDGTHSTAA